MQINVIYDQSVSSLPTGFVAAVNYVVNYFDTTFTNPVTVNIDLGYGEIAGQSLGSGALGESETYFDSFSYSQAVNALKANQPSATQQAAYSTLPGSSPVSGGTLWASTAEEKALGLLAGNNSAIDGYVGFSSTYPFSYSATATPGAGQYYFDGVLAHEFSEVLGRSSMLGEGLGGTNSYTIMDLFRYSAPGVRQLGTGGPAYFSINNGTTNLDSWNTNPNGDLGDWAGSAGADAFLAFSNSGQINWITQSDLTLLNVLGWDTAPLTGIAVSGTSSEALQGGSSVTLLAAAPNITDPASSTLTSATIKITNGGGSAVLGDELYVNGKQSGNVAGGAVTVSWNNSTKVLTLTGAASIATYDTLLSQVAYKDTGTDASSGSHPVRTLTWTVNDGSQNLSTASQITIDRAPVANNDVATDVVGISLSASASSGVLANDTDLDADALAVISVSDTAHGAGAVGQPLAGVYGHITLNSDGSYTYVADISSAINVAPTGSHLHDIFTYTAGDGNGGVSSPATLNITLDRPPVLTVANLSVSYGRVLPASSLLQVSDPDGDTITNYAFWDTGTGGGHFVLNGVAQGTNQEIAVSAAQLTQLSYQSGGTDTLWVEAFAGAVSTGWSSSFTVTAPVDTGPVETVSNLTANHGQSFAGSSLFTYSDPVGSAATQYDLWDTGSGGGHFVLNGVTLGAHQDNIITAAQLAQLSYQSGSGADTLWVRANDGSMWGAWSSSFTVTAPVDTGPVEAVSNRTATHGQSFASLSLFAYSDPFGSAATQYDVWDTGSGGGHFVLNGVTLGANQDNIITAAQLAQLSYQSGSGADTLWVRANDGTVWGAWSSSFTVTAPVDAGPVETVSNLTATHGQSFAGSSLFTYSDPIGSAATQYDFWDTGSGGGHFVLNGVTLGTNQDNIITAAQLAQLSYQSGSGADTLWVRANDGPIWGAWSSSFTVTAPVDTGPVEAVSNLTATHGQSFASSSLFAYSDPVGSAATQYDVWDTGSGGGHFVLNGVTLGANQDNIITAAQLAQLSYQSGSGADTLWVRANDGTVWGSWSSSFTVMAPFDTGPLVTLEHSTVNSAQGQSFAVSSLFTYSDPFGSAATQYDVWDTGGGGGEFLLNNTPLGVNQDNIITAARLSQLTYQVGSGTDTLWIRANDGTVWGAWSPSFTMSDPPTIGAGGTLELASAYSGTLSFAGTTGTLKIDNSASFSGKIGGQLAIGDVIDLADITAGAKATIGYTGNNSPGTLTVSDGTHTASIALLGNYSLANFTASSDGHGGTSVVDPPIVPPGDAAGRLNQQMALFSQSLASFAPSDGGGGRDGAPLGYDPGQLSNLTQPAPSHLHA